MKGSAMPMSGTRIEMGSVQFEIKTNVENKVELGTF
jgi:hypothetical protein